MLGRIFSAPLPLYISPRPRLPATRRPPSPPAARGDPDQGVSVLPPVPEGARAVDARRTFDPFLGRSPAPRDHALPLEFLEHARAGLLPRLPHVLVQVPRSRRRSPLAFCFRRRRRLTLGHGTSPLDLAGSPEGTSPDQVGPGGTPGAISRVGRPTPPPRGAELPRVVERLDQEGGERPPLPGGPLT